MRFGRGRVGRGRSSGPESGSLPDWVPPEGYLANVSLNTMADVRPSGWPSSDIAGPFANWSGGAYAPDFSELGAMVYHGSGHLANQTNPIWAGVWCFDLSTRMWVGRCVPPAPITDEAEKYNEYGESIEEATLGHTYTPHTYDGCIYQPSSLGGGPKGSFIRVSHAGSTFKQAIHRFDLSKESDPPTRVVDDLNMVSNYPACDEDYARGGFWALSGTGRGPLKFISFADWSVTAFNGIEYNQYGDHSLIYVPTRDCLVGMGRSGTGGVNLSIFVSKIIDNIPQQWVQVSYTGTPPARHSVGGRWSTLLNCIVSYEADGSYTVHKLHLPDDLINDEWEWTSETLTGLDGAEPSKNSASGRSFSRFLEVPKIKSFLWCDSVNGPVQAFRLTGMT